MPLHPRPLSAEAVAAARPARASASDADAAVLPSRCHAATGGNPLLLNELLKALETEGVQPVATHVATVRELGPRAASRAVLVRLARLHADAVAVARAVAVLGDGADLTAVAGLAGVDLQSAARATGQLARAEIMRHEPPLGFVHPLVAGAVYRDIPPGERELQHERAAQLSTRRRPRRAGRRAPAGRPVARRGAGRRRARGSAAASAGACARARPSCRLPDSARLAEPPPAGHEGRGRWRLLLELGVAEMLTFGPGGDAAPRLAYERLEDPLLRATAAQHLVRALLFTGDPAASAAVARAVAEELPAERRRRPFRRPSSRPSSSAPAEFADLRIEPPASEPERLGEKMLASVVAIERAVLGRCPPPSASEPRCRRSPAAT